MQGSENLKSENKAAERILEFHSNYYKLPKILSLVLKRMEIFPNVYDTCLSLWKLDFHFIPRRESSVTL